MTAETSSKINVTQSLYQDVYKSLMKGQSLKQIESTLVEDGIDIKTASLIVQEVVSTQDAVKKGDLGYWAWIKHVIANPFRSGFLIGLLTLVSGIFTFVAAIIGFMLFPAGTYPKIVLAAPGIIAGLVFFLVLSWFVYLLCL